MTEARGALTDVIQRYPSGPHVGEAQDLLGEVNISILLSDYPSPEKEDYTVRGGDVLARVAAKMKTTPELIMRTNNLSGTMLRIGQKLLISRPEFSLLIQRNAQLLYLLDHEHFFKRYHLREDKLPANAAAKNGHPRRRNHGLEKWQADRHRQPGIPQQHALDSTRLRRLHALFRAG